MDRVKNEKFTLALTTRLSTRLLYGTPATDKGPCPGFSHFFRNAQPQSNSFSRIGLVVRSDSLPSIRTENDPFQEKLAAGRDMGVGADRRQTPALERGQQSTLGNGG